MSLTLKDCVNPWKAAEKNLLVSGQITVTELDRLSEALLEDDSVVDVALEFKRTEGKLPIVTGRLEGSLVLECQRCLQPMKLPVNSKFSLAFVDADTAVKTAENDSTDDHAAEYDLYEVEDERVCLADVIEDELLLLLPQVPVHTAPACVIKTEYGDEQIAEAEDQKENPFAVLASLKDKLNS